MPDRRSRRASRRLCEEYLISPEGRRLSLEENEIRRQLNLPRETLGRLVASRLLRSESRSESTYYELSHDALVEPILASRRTKAQVMGMLGIGAGALLILICLGIVLESAPYSEIGGPRRIMVTAIWLVIGVPYPAPAADRGVACDSTAWQCSLVAAISTLAKTRHYRSRNAP